MTSDALFLSREIKGEGEREWKGRGELGRYLGHSGPSAESEEGMEMGVPMMASTSWRSLAWTLRWRTSSAMAHPADSALVPTLWKIISQGGQHIHELVIILLAWVLAHALDQRNPLSKPLVSALIFTLRTLSTRIALRSEMYKFDVFFHILDQVNEIRPLEEPLWIHASSKVGPYMSAWLTFLHSAPVA